MKKQFCFLILIFSTFFIFSQNYSKQQLIPADSWVYDALYTLSAEQNKTINADFVPCSINEISFLLKSIDYDLLSDAGKNLYDEVDSFLRGRNKALDLAGVSFGFNMDLHPELLFKSNSQIPWTYGNQNSVTYTIESYDKNGVLEKSEDKTYDFVDVSNYSGNRLTKPLIQFPVSINVADYAYFQTNPFITNKAIAMVRPNTFSNVFMAFEDMEFMQPITAYFSTSYIFNDKIGIAFQIGKEGMQLGHSSLGSVIYNDTFQTDAYYKLDFFSSKFKLDLSVEEIKNDRFLYLHSFEAIPFKWLRLGVLEGILVNDSFELRFINPLMIYHSFHAWTEYSTEEEKKVYHESHESAYFGFNFDVVPLKNLRIYGLYSQVELQIPSELKSEYGKRLPNSFSVQLGTEYNVPLFNGWFNAQIEGLYSTPYMYYKTGADWSLYQYRFDNYSSTKNPLCSWIGSPFGPDSAGFQLKLGYKDNHKWKIGLEYLFMAHGENSFNLFFDTVTIDGVKYWKYYPSVKINDTWLTAPEVARSMKLSGIIEYLNRFTINFDYELNKHISFDGQLDYSFLFNTNHAKDNFQQGIQLSVGMEYILF